MGFSPLATMSRRIPPSGRQTPRNSPIRGFTIHHQAGVNAHGQATAPGREVSANYWITNEGAILPNIDETMRAWTTGAPGYPGGAQSDHRNITVEVSNSPEGVRNGSWAISDKAMTALVNLIADVFKRHRLGTVRRGTQSGVAVHQDFVPTACPGPFIMNRLSSIIEQAEKVRLGVPEEEVDPMPKISQSNRKATQKAGKDWTTLTVHEKGYISLMEGGGKARRVRGLVNLAVSGGDIDVRVVRVVTNQNGSKELSTHTLPFKTLRPGYGDYSFGLDLPAGKTNRLRLQVRSRGKSAGQVDNVQALLDWWDQ